MTDSVERAPVDVLRRISLFAGLSTGQLEALAARSQRRVARRGDVLCRVGEPGDEFFAIARGVVRILVPGPRGDERVNEIGSGDWFGEMALITGEPRAATAVAQSDVELLAIGRRDFQDLLLSDPAISLAMAQVLSRRLRARLLRREEPVGAGVIAAVASEPSLREAVLLRNFAAALVLEGAPRLAVLDTVALPALASTWPNDAVEIPIVSGGIADLEALTALHRPLLVRIDASDPAAPELVGAADRFIALDADDPGLRASRWLVDRESDEPVLSIRVAPAPSRAWCAVSEQALADPALLEHAPQSRSARELRRLARKVLGRRIGLALSAGGARGLAHVGALRVFEQAGIEFDAVAGTSMGGIVGALLVLGHSSDAMLDTFRSVAANLRAALVDPGLPEVSILRGERKTATIRSYTGEVEIADLDRPFFAVSADLVSGREVVFSSGPLWRALDATSAIPVAFPPVLFEGRALIDGWVVNPLPTDVLRREGVERVIAVDASAGVDHTAHPHGESSDAPASGLRGLRRRLANPAIVRVAMRAMEMGGRERSLANLALADACVQPDVTKFSVLDARALEEIVAIGEAAAEAALPAIADVAGVRIPGAGSERAGG